MIIEHFIDPERQGSYYTIPFQMPADTERFMLRYHYERHHESESPAEHGRFIARHEVNIIDLGLIAPDGRQVGASGSDKTEFEVSATHATPGYRPSALDPGEWHILVGAYKIAPAGVTVHYELTFTPKRLRLFKGDLHVHTLGSDGVLSADELARHAQRHGLDFLAVTDHNQMVSADSLPHLPGLTLIPGIEWTHYQGHANFLGVDRPYDDAFHTNDLEGVQARFRSARERGALITINHPFDEGCPFTFDLNSLPFDCLEVWNGPMRMSNLQAVGRWHSLLAAGKKIPISAGSDYHRSQLFLFPGGPTTCVFSPSASPVDILQSLKQGHAYLVFAPDGPSLEPTAGGAMLGDSVAFADVRELHVRVAGLRGGDHLKVVTQAGDQPLLKAEADGTFEGIYQVKEPGFARVEVWRPFVPGIPPLPALISNPVYFDA